MPEDSFEERTEQASPKRKKEAREKGNVAKSTEVNSVLVLLTGIILLRIMGPWLFQRVGAMSMESFALINTPVMDHTAFIAHFTDRVLDFFKMTLPIILVIMGVGLFSNVIQIGFLLTLKPLMPKLEKINPLSGFKRMFSLRSLVEAAKSVLKVLIISFVAFLIMKGAFNDMLTLCYTTIGAIWVFILQLGFKIVIGVALVLIILAILDYAYQRFEHEKKLKMTKQEVKEERKQIEGDPMVKSRIRSLQREMARRRMMEEVPKATVVVTNPTHLAIAIRYEASEMETPEVVAKGKNVIAEKIKEIAKKSDVPIVEDKPLARAMYDVVQPGDSIPFQFFNAVAEILAYVYKLKNKVAA